MIKESGLKLVGAAIDKMLNPNNIKEKGYILLTFPLAKNSGGLGYLANIGQEDALKIMAEFSLNLAEMSNTPGKVQ